MSAIERLREAAAVLNGNGDHRFRFENEHTAQDHEDALAAVDALYQAAKNRGHDSQCARWDGGECNCDHQDLAAAVRRVEGQA